MKVRALSVIAAAGLVALFVAPAARAASPPPVSPPPVKGPGVSAIPVSSTPFNFVFATRVTGNGFRPGERVTISVERAGAAPISVNAGPDGTVSAVLTFSWVFCGPNAVTTAPPIIVLAGSSGSRQQVALPASPCPRLVVTLPPAVKVPPSGGTGSVGGTASTGPPVPAPGPLPDPRLRVPSAQIVDVMGFGFAPHEIVQLTEIGFSSAPQTTTVSADTLGRLTAALHLLVPPPCSAQVGRIWLVASGNRGTTAAAPIGFWRPVALMCPVTSGGTTKPDNPPSPAAATAGPASPGLHLAHAAVRRGHSQSAVIGFPTGTSLTVSVAYPGGVKQTFRRRTSQVDTVIHWHVPAKTRPGTATVTMASPSLSLTLEQRFTVR